MQFNYNANRVSNTNKFVTTIDFPLYTCWFGEFIRIASGDQNPRRKINEWYIRIHARN